MLTLDKNLNKSITIKVENIALESHSFAYTCLEYAKKAKKNEDIFHMRMFARTSVIHSALSAEADLIKMIEFTLRDKLYDMLSDKQLSDKEKNNRKLMYEYLTNYQTHQKSKYNQVKSNISNVENKYKYLRSINKLESKELPPEYKELTLLRNKLVHYMNTYQPIAYSEDLIEEAACALHFAGEFILHIRGISKQDPAAWTFKSKPSSKGYDYN